MGWTTGAESNQSSLHHLTPAVQLDCRTDSVESLAHGSARIQETINGRSKQEVNRQGAEHQVITCTDHQHKR